MHGFEGLVEIIKGLTEVEMWSWCYLGACVGAVHFVLIIILFEATREDGLPIPLGKIAFDAWVVEGILSRQRSFVCLEFFAWVTGEHVELRSW